MPAQNKPTQTAKNKRIYLVEGVGYTAFFDSIKERNAFNKQVEALYEQMMSDPKFRPNPKPLTTGQLTAMHSSIAIATARALKIKHEVHIKPKK
jgi:hypothetical protein